MKLPRLVLHKRVKRKFQTAFSLGNNNYIKCENRIFRQNKTETGGREIEKWGTEDKS